MARQFVPVTLDGRRQTSCVTPFMGRSAEVSPRPCGTTDSFRSTVLQANNDSASQGSGLDRIHEQNRGQLTCEDGGDYAGQRARESIGHFPFDADSVWWVGKIRSLPSHLCSGWVVSQALVEYANEAEIAQACHKRIFADRMDRAGLGSLLSDAEPPRKRCAS